MRRIYSILAAFLLLLTLFGCKKQGDTGQSPRLPAVDNSSFPTADVQMQIQQQPMIAASMPIVTQNYTDESGQIQLQHIYQNLELIVPDQDVADAIIIDYLNRTDKFHTTAESLFAEAVAANKSEDTGDTFLFQTTYEPKRLDRGVLSLLGSTIIHKGYSHPEVTAESVSYDLATGKALTISDILRPDADLQTLSDHIRNALQEQENTVTFYEGYDRTVQELLENPTNWYFSPNGLVFYYSPYEIAPYSSGVITAQVEYEKLTNILSDAYFPAESDKVKGQLFITPLDVDQLDQFTQIAEVVCTPNEQQYMLYTDGLLEDIRIEQLKEHTAYTIFASPHISPGDGIAIYVSPSDTYKIHYTTEGKRAAKTLAFTADGTPQLTD